jgi:hypothetical protein
MALCRKLNVIAFILTRGLLKVSEAGTCTGSNRADGAFNDMGIANEARCVPPRVQFFDREIKGFPAVFSMPAKISKILNMGIRK